MSTSVLLVVIIGGLGIAFYALGVLVMRGDRPLWRAMVEPKLLGMLGGILGLALVGGFMNQSLAETTLYEAVVDGTTTEVPATRSFSVGVEHPDAEHEILVDLQAEDAPAEAATVAVRVVDGTGQVLVDHTRSAAWRCKKGCGFEALYDYVTPRVPGYLTVAVTVSTPGVDAVHFAVFDEDKTDGERIPGY